MNAIAGKVLLADDAVNTICREQRHSVEDLPSTDMQRETDRDQQLLR